MKTRQQAVEGWLHERLCVPDDECAGPHHHAEQSRELLRLINDTRREELLLTLASCAVKYVMSKTYADYTNLKSAAEAWQDHLKEQTWHRG